MNCRNSCRNLIVFALLGALVSSTAFAGSFTQDQIKEILTDFQSWDYGKDPTPTHTINKVVQFLSDGNKPQLRSFTEKQMIVLLESNESSRATKQFICQQLWIIGSDASLPVLEKMLLDTETAQMACYALCTNLSNTVDRVLQQALDRVPDESKVCIINVLGDRRDAGSVDRLSELVGAESDQIAQAAARALGKIGGNKATETIKKARAAASGDRHAVLTEAYLNCAEVYVGNKQSAKALAIYTKLLDDSESLLVRRAALVGVLHSGHRGAVKLMIAAIGQDEPILSAAAIANSVGLKGTEVTQKLVAEFETATASTQVQLIKALIQRDDPLARNAITSAASSKDASVRMAAFIALAEIGDAATAALLCNALEKAKTQAEVDTILASLQRMQGEQVSRAILGATRDAPPSTKIQLIQVITSRSYNPAVPLLLALCRSDETPVARAALRAIGTLASYQEMPQLLDLLVGRQGQALQIQALRAVTTVIGRNDQHQDDIARLVQGRLDSTVAIAARCSLLQVLSAVSNELSLQRLRAASEDRNPSVRDVAIRTLAKYPDPAAIEALLQVFQTSTDSAHRAVALSGCVRLLKTDKIPPGRAIKVYEQLVAHASTPAEKKLILSGLAVVRHPAARGIAEDFMNDDAVKAEAALALEAIARNTPATVDFNDETTALNGKTGGAKLVDSPIAGKALSLNGTDARIELPRSQAWSVGNGAFTVALWVHPASPKQAGILCVGGYNWRHGWLIDVHSDGSVRLETSDASSRSNGSIRTSGGMLASGRWTHIAIAVSRGDDDARIFINGHEKAKGKIGAVDLTNLEANVVIGGIENNNRNNFHGEIDEVTIRKQILSADEIQALVEPGGKLVAAYPNTGKKLEQISPAVGTWQFTRETDRGTVTSTLKIKDAKSGTYTVRDNEVDLDELAVDGNQVAFKVTLRFNDRKFAMQFKGTVEGITLKGQWTTPRGTRDVEAKRVATSLFDGKTFGGWEGDLEFFRIEEGAIVAGSLEEPIPHNTFLATTKEYGDFELKLKAKLTGKGDNAGIQFRSRRIPGSHEMIGYQADMGHNAEANIWACLYDESRRRSFLAEPNQDELAKVFSADDWNEFTIRCVGRHVQIWLNGYLAIDYTESDYDIERRGMIGVQIHGGAPSEAWYKDMTIKEL